MYRTVIRAVAATVVAVLATVAGFAAPVSAAAAPSPSSVVSFVTFDSDVARTHLNLDFPVGDCILFQGSQVVLGRPDANGFSYVEWTGTLRTTFTTHLDVFYLDVTFEDSFGTVIAASGTMDGPKMALNRDYDVDFYRPLIVDPVLWPLISRVTWSAHC